MSFTKKLIVSMLFALAVAGCNSSRNILSSDLLQSGEYTMSSFIKPIDGDEKGGASGLFSNSTATNKLILPPLPTSPVFAAFNNDYKGLFADNEVIAHNDPKNTDKYFFSLLESAKTTIDASVYDINDPGAVNEFVKAAKRGIKIRFVTDGNNIKDATDPTKPSQAIKEMKAAGITVVASNKSHGLMHDKFIIVDNNKVWTGSYNLSSFGMYRDNQNIVLINSPQMAANYNLVFNRLFHGEFENNPPVQIPNPVVNLPGTTIKTFFSPNGGTSQAILNELQNAHKVKFMAFSFTSKDIAAQLVKINQKPGGQVEGVYDACEASNSSEQFVLDSLRQNKIWIHPDGNQALLHHKTMIIDDTTVITGSFNFSISAEIYNNENTVIIKSPTIAKLYNDEYARIKQASLTNTNLPPYDHPACGGPQPSPVPLN